MPREYEATVTAQRWKKQKCEHCGERYAYRMRRTVSATAATGYFGSDKATARQAKEDAADKVDAELANSFDCIPCPHCGQFQTKMIEELAQRKTRKLRLGMFVSAGIAAVGAFILAVTVSAAMKSPNTPNPNLQTGAPQGRGNDTAITFIGVPGVITLLAAGAGVGCYIARKKILANFDPYEGRSPEQWKKRAFQMGAVTVEEYERRAAAEQAANPVYEENLVNEEPVNPFKDDPAPKRENPKPNLRAKPAPPPPQDDDNPFKFN